MTDQTDQQVTIYALIDPRDGSTRYVGQTRGELDVRLATHRAARGWGDSPKDAWLRNLDGDGMQPIIQAIATTTADVADEVERSYIVRYAADGHTLTNIRHNPLPPASWDSTPADGCSVQLRLPRWMRDELNALRQGRRIKRSLNAEIVAGLDQYLTDQHTKDKSAPRG